MDRLNFEASGHSGSSCNPRHPVFDTHRGREGQCVPIAIHCDEGCTLKKKSIMIVQYHSLMGKGTRKRKSTEEEPGINMIGNSYTTRVSMERDAGSGLWWEKKETVHCSN